MLSSRHRVVIVPMRDHACQHSGLDEGRAHELLPTAESLLATDSH